MSGTTGYDLMVAMGHNYAALGTMSCDLMASTRYNGAMASEQERSAAQSTHRPQADAAGDGTHVNVGDATAVNDETRRVLRRLLKAHEAYYDVREHYQLAGRAFDGFAEFHSSESQYVLVKRAKLWEAHTHEYVFFHRTPHLTGSELAELIRFMTGPALELVRPEPDHKASYLSLIIIAGSADSIARDGVRRVRFRKNLKLGFGGWIDLRLALVDVAAKSVVTNGQGKSMRETLSANLAKE